MIIYKKYLYFLAISKLKNKIKLNISNNKKFNKKEIKKIEILFY
jgi:hypothetical protein